ncbi:hypothetical protein H4582DRAFT_1949510 [Lactarius indigo]|nr:hypothetical protein H4582DRAFT_1949510 [Lactarius indigo]
MVPQQIFIHSSFLSRPDNAELSYKGLSTVTVFFTSPFPDQEPHFMSSQSRFSISSRTLYNSTPGTIGEGRFPRGARARPVNIPERRLWSHGRPKFYIHDSSSSSQGSASTKSSRSGSTTSEGRGGHTASPYGSFFVEDMEIDGPVDNHSPSRGGGGGRTRGTTADLNRAVHQSSAWRPPPSQNEVYRRQSPMAPGFIETTGATYFGTHGVLPVPGGNVAKEGEATPSTLTSSTHRSEFDKPTTWDREYRNRTSGHHNSQVRPPWVVTGTALPPGSTLSNSDRQKSRGMTRTTWRK